MSLEKLVIEHCAPTLAKIKTGNLINVKYTSKECLLAEYDVIKEKLSEKGISIKILKDNNTSLLVYVYRINFLKADFKNNITKNILKECGYLNINASCCINNLISRLEEYKEFPHEIGLFLGYPPEDVYDFICNKGQNACYCGYWQVYNNVSQSFKKFKQFDMCKAIFKKRFDSTKNISQLIVA